MLTERDKIKVTLMVEAEITGWNWRQFAKIKAIRATVYNAKLQGEPDDVSMADRIMRDAYGVLAMRQANRELMPLDAVGKHVETLQIAVNAIAEDMQHTKAKDWLETRWMSADAIQYIRRFHMPWCPSDRR